MSAAMARAVSLAGILNVTPDSFSDGGLITSPEIAVARAKRLIAEGATILDIGGESTRPGAVPVEESTELSRVIPVIERIHAMLRATHLPCRISIDTYRPAVAHRAILAGASLINDVRAASVPGMIELLQTFSGRCDDPTDPTFLDPHMRKIDICLMHGYAEHQSGVPPEVEIVTEVRNFLRARMRALLQSGIAPSRILLDPGIGFGKNSEQNITLLRNLIELRELGCRLLVGVSRKRFLRNFLPPSLPEAIRTGASIGVAIAICPWVDILRVHDVAATYQAIQAYNGTVR